MQNRRALSIVVAWANLLSVPSIAFAAIDCVTEPKAAGPGQHWYYQFDTVNHRKCWFAVQSVVQVRHAAPLSQPPSKPMRDTAPKTAPLKTGEPSSQVNSFSEQANREQLFREFVLWDVFRQNGELEGSSK